MCAARGASRRALAAAVRAFARPQAIRPLTAGGGGVGSSYTDLVQRAVTPAVCAHLQREGYAVVDGVLLPPLVAELGEELRALHRAGALHLNATHLVTATSSGPGTSSSSGGATNPSAASPPVAAKQTQLLHKAHIWEAELSLDAAVRRAAPAFAGVDADTSLMTMLNLFMPGLRLGSQATKLQLNEGSGGCFPLHTDSDEALDGRRVTAIMYLNQDWDPAAGGQVRLYPWPQRPPLDIQPAAGRLLLFSSMRMLHRVLPCSRERLCFTTWLSQAPSPRAAARQAQESRPAPPTAGGASDEEAARFLLAPAIRKHVLKLAYADEWEQSLREAHPASDATEAALAAHAAELATIRTALARHLPAIDRLSARCLEGGVGGPGEGRGAPAVAWF